MIGMNRLHQGPFHCVVVLASYIVFMQRKAQYMMSSLPPIFITMVCFNHLCRGLAALILLLLQMADLLSVGYEVYLLRMSMTHDQGTGLFTSEVGSSFFVRTLCVVTT
jgi:hypothetical protein